jgi:hypothetical protein
MLSLFLYLPSLLRYLRGERTSTDLKDYREEYAFYGNRDRVILQFPSPYSPNFPRALAGLSIVGLCRLDYLTRGCLECNSMRERLFDPQAQVG